MRDLLLIIIVATLSAAFLDYLDRPPVRIGALPPPPVHLG